MLQKTNKILWWLMTIISTALKLFKFSLGNIAKFHLKKKVNISSADHSEVIIYIHCYICILPDSMEIKYLKS